MRTYPNYSTSGLPDTIDTEAIVISSRLLNPTENAGVTNRLHFEAQVNKLFENLKRRNNQNTYTHDTYRQ